MPALVTPFNANDEVDKTAVRWLCRNVIDSGARSLICVGSLGEFTSLTDEERSTVIKCIVDEANGKVPVIAGVGAASTKIAVKIAKQAEDIGADAVSVLAPFYFNIGDAAVRSHYEEIASSLGIPVLIYNFPGTTKVTMSPELIAKLAENENIIGIKNSVDSLTHLRQIIRSTAAFRSKFLVIAGLEEYLIAGFLLGAAGSVSGISNFVCKTMVEIYNLCASGNITAASDMYNKIIIPLKELAPPPEPVGALKVGASLVGPVNARVRLPLLEPPASTREKMKAILVENGIV